MRRLEGRCAEEWNVRVSIRLFILIFLWIYLSTNKPHSIKIRSEKRAVHLMRSTLQSINLRSWNGLDCVGSLDWNLNGGACKGYEVQVSKLWLRLSMKPIGERCIVGSLWSVHGQTPMQQCLAQIGLATLLALHFTSVPLGNAM